MKKNKILILLISLFSIFVVSDRVDALSYSVNGSSYNVTDLESLRDYCYFTYAKSNNYQFWVLYRTSTQWYCGFRDNSSKSFFINSGVRYNASGTSNNNYPLGYYYVTDDTYNLNTSNDGRFLYSSGTSYFAFTSIPIYSDYTRNTVLTPANFTFQDIENKYAAVVYYDIKYYLNNELIDTITVEEGSSHTLKPTPNYNSSTQNWSGWTYDSNINLSNITSDVNIYGTVSDKSSYIITYYINNEVYRTESVYEGDSYTLLDYTPLKNYNFSGWSYDQNYNFSNVNENMSIYGTSEFVRPTMHYSEEIDSTIHSLSVSILGREIPVEFDFLYTIMDFIILILLVICVIAPFIIVFKLLGGGF